MTDEEALKYGIRVARSMWKDPEAESLAGEVVLNALRAYDGRIPPERWVAICVRNAVWDAWRKLRDGHTELKEGTWWEGVFVLPDDLDTSELQMPQADWQLLCEHLEEKVPLDVLARRRGISLYAVRQQVADAVEKFMDTKS